MRNVASRVSHSAASSAIVFTGGAAPASRSRNSELFDQPLKCRAQRLWRECIGQQAVDAVDDEVGNPTGPQSNHRYLVHESLMNHQRRVFRPQRGHDENIDCGVDLRDVGAIEAAVERDRQTGGGATQAGDILRKHRCIPVEMNLEGAVE